MLEAGEDLRFTVTGSRGTDPFSQETTIDPSDPVIVVYLATVGITTYMPTNRHGYGMRSYKGRTYIETYISHYAVIGNGAGAEGDPFESYKTIFAGQIGTALGLFSSRALQENAGFLSPELFAYWTQLGNEIQRYVTDILPDGRYANGILRGEIDRQNPE